MNFLDFVEDARAVKVPKYPWMDKCRFVLGTKANLKDIIDHCLKHPRVALDLETTGLDNRVFNGKTVDHIVGVCLSPDGETGYYIPLRHKAGSQHNVPWSLFKTEFKRLIDACLAEKLVFVFHGGNFDQEFLEFNGDESLGGECWDKASCWDDTEIEVFMLDTRRLDKRLKTLSQEEVGIKQLELEDLWSEEDKKKPGWRPDFAALDPSWEGTLLYGGGDGIATWRLDEKFHTQVVNPDKFGHSLRNIYAIEKACVAATRWMRRNRLKIDREKVIQLIKLGQQEWYDAVMAVYEAAQAALKRDVMPGHYKWLRDTFIADDPNNLKDEQLERAKTVYKTKYPDPAETVQKVVGSEVVQFPYIYDINSQQQLGQLFQEMGVPGLNFTEKSGQVKTSKGEIDRIVEETGDRYPFMLKVKRFREVDKALSNYLLPMLHESEPSDNTAAIKWRAHKVDTGRFATPAKDKNAIRGWPQLNLQSLPATYDPNRPECMTRLRECIVGRDGKWVVAIDFSGVELRLVTNLSREPKWLDEFFHCSSCDRKFDKGDGLSTPMPPPARCPNCGSDKIGDLHTLTGLQVYGADAMDRPDWKQCRQRAKGANFALCYGGGGSAVSRSTGCDTNEGWRIKKLFDDAYRTLRSWWGAQHAFARQRGYVLTAFGRKYPVPDIHNQDGGFRSKAERNSVNGPIQGSSADITKLAMALVYKEVKRRGWLSKCLMVITMHDELVFEIDGDILEEAIAVIKNIMCRNKFVLAQKWPIPLTSDVEIGYSWAVPWNLDAMRSGEVRFHGDKKVKDKKKAAEMGLDWDSLPSFPAVLAPLFKYKTLDVPPPSEFKADAPEAGAPPSEPPPPPPQDPEPPATPQTPAAPEVHEEPPVSPEAVAARPRPPKGLKMGDTFEYRLSCPLTNRTAMTLGEVIRLCIRKGTKVLKLVTRDGTVLNELPDWAEWVGPEPVIVDPEQFFHLAQSYRL